MKRRFREPIAPHGPRCLCAPCGLSSGRAVPIEDAAALLGCTTRRVMQLANAGLLRVVPTFGRYTLLERISIDALLKSPRDLRSPNGKRVHTPDTLRRKFERYLAETYKMAAEDWARLYEAQGGKCPGCRRVLTFDRNTHVDHDHATGRVRGLLCDPCNRALGNVDDSPETLRSLARYLVVPYNAGTTDR